MVSLQDSTATEVVYRAPPPPRVSVQALSDTSSHGVPTRRLTRSIQGSSTDVCIQEYVDRTFVIVTQVGKLGVVTQASLPNDTPFATAAASTNDAGWQEEDEQDVVDTHQSETLFTPTPNLVQTPLLGVAPQEQADLYSLYVSCIYSTLRRSKESSRTGEFDGTHQEEQRDQRPIVVALGLKLSTGGTESETAEIAEAQRETFLEVMRAVKDCYASQGENHH